MKCNPRKTASGCANVLFIAEMRLSYGSCFGGLVTHPKCSAVLSVEYTTHETFWRHLVFANNFLGCNFKWNWKRSKWQVILASLRACWGNMSNCMTLTKNLQLVESQGQGHCLEVERTHFITRFACVRGGEYAILGIRAIKMYELFN